MGQDRNFSMHVALLTAVLEKGSNWEMLSMPCKELELPPGNKGKIYYHGLAMGRSMWTYFLN